MAVSAPTAPRARSGDHGDRALAARAGRGDERAFAELYDRHAAGLLAFSSQYVGDRAAAEDVVQQTFMAAHRVLSEGTELEHPRAWLYRVARNNALTTIRDRGPVDAELAAELHDRAAAVPAQVERREALQAVVRDIVALPAEQRAALALYELGDLSQAEIADTLGCNPARVKALVFQARSALVTQRDARDASCEAVREKLATFHGGALNHRLIRHHLRGCAACTAYRDELRDQRRRVALLLPLLPAPMLRESLWAVRRRRGRGDHEGCRCGRSPEPGPIPLARHRRGDDGRRGRSHARGLAQRRGSAQGAPYRGGSRGAVDGARARASGAIPRPPARREAGPAHRRATEREAAPSPQARISSGRGAGRRAGRLRTEPAAPCSPRGARQASAGEAPRAPAPARGPARAGARGAAGGRAGAARPAPAAASPRARGVHRPQPRIRAGPRQRRGPQQVQGKVSAASSRG